MKSGWEKKSESFVSKMPTFPVTRFVSQCSALPSFSKVTKQSLSRLHF